MTSSETNQTTPTEKKVQANYEKDITCSFKVLLPENLGLNDLSLMCVVSEGFGKTFYFYWEHYWISPRIIYNSIMMMMVMIDLDEIASVSISRFLER